MADDDLCTLLETLDPKARDDLRRVLIRDQADRDAISSQLMRYRDANGQRWADLIDFADRKGTCERCPAPSLTRGFARACLTHWRHPPLGAMGGRNQTFVRPVWSMTFVAVLAQKTRVASIRFAVP